MNESKRLAVLGAGLIFFLAGTVSAQPPAGGGAGGFPNVDPQQMQNFVQQFRNMDPAQLQEMMQQFQNMDPQQMRGAAQQLLTMDPQQIQKTMEERQNASLREEMGVTNDGDWTRIQERIKAVTKAQAAVSVDATSALLAGGMVRGLGGRANALQGLVTLSPEAQSLQAAIDAKKSNGEIKNLLSRLREAREARRADLVRAQDELRALLTPRQEVAAVLRGLLD
jgi:hypothetical protein